MIVRLTSGEKNIGINFPATPDDVRAVYSAFAQMNRKIDSVAITDVSSPIENLTEYVQNVDLASPADIEKLNALAEKIDGMTPWEQWTFSGALDAESINSLDDVLNVASLLENNKLIAAVTSDRELGEFLVDSGNLPIEEHLRPYIDYAKVGAEYYSNFGGAYTSHGYVQRRDQKPALHDENPVFHVKLQAQDGTREYALHLPASDAELDTAKRHLRISDFSDAKIAAWKCTDPQLTEMLPRENITVQDADQLAQHIQWMQETDGEMMKYLAALAVEKPNAFHEALTIAIDIDDYERVPEDAAEYGEQALRHIGADDELIETIDGYMDFAGLGEQLMEEDGVRWTDYGLIRRLSSPFPEMRSGQQML